MTLLISNEQVCRGCSLHTDPQERSKTTTASSDCRPRPTAPDPVAPERQEPESSENIAKGLTQKRQQARYTAKGDLKQEEKANAEEATERGD